MLPLVVDFGLKQTGNRHFVSLEAQPFVFVMLFGGNRFQELDQILVRSLDDLMRS